MFWIRNFKHLINKSQRTWQLLGKKFRYRKYRFSMMKNVWKIKREKKLFILLLFSTCTMYFFKNSLKSVVIRTYAKYYRPNLPVSVNYIRNKDNTNKSILYWNEFFDFEDMGLGLGSEIFQKCPISNCFSTKNRNMMSVEQFDAIIFHGARYSTFYHDYPKKRSLHQKYVFYSLESPYNTIFDKFANVNFYNWTLTYRRDSDIHHPYALIQCLDNKTNYSIPTLEQVSKKTFHVAWFVSNCETPGSERRLKYALELSKYIDVHIYGTCGNYTCPRSSHLECLEMVENNYKFYLSFENSLCLDYITEKFYYILNMNVIPIVFGLADHSSIAPQKSFIDVYDFDSPKELAQRLREISDNYEDYISYFEWKKNCVVTTKRARIKEFVICQLCELLNRPQKPSIYEDIQNWFYGHKCFL